MVITIINDCKDRNAEGRQVARASSLFACPVNFVSVSSNLDEFSTLEASGNILDIFDAMDGREGVLLVNVAPRSGKAKKWENGTPFCYFFYDKMLVVASIDGFVLSLVKKFGLVDFVNLMDIPVVLEEMIEKKYISENLKNHITNTQFRSFDFVPRVAKYIYDNKSANSKKVSISEIADAPKTVWWVDNFGNCKTTLLKEDLDIDDEGFVNLKIGKIKFYEKLKDVPNGEPALIVGSSGLGENRFVEIVLQGKRADKSFNISVGSDIL